jgi:murein DD-endopeptidase MepM/ murein hydrolase activator NlpD
MRFIDRSADGTDILSVVTDRNGSVAPLKFRYAAIAIGLVWASSVSLVRADDAVVSPDPVPTQPAVTEPTLPPPTDVAQPTQPPIVEPTAPPQVDNTPIVVKQEQETPVLSTSEPGMVPTQVESTLPPTATDTNPQNYPTPPSGSQSPTRSPGSTPVTVGAPPVTNIQSGAAPGVTLPPTNTASGSNGDASLNFNYSSTSAQAPPELTCSGNKQTSAAAPFLVAPYAGWTEIISFLDHDSPDYAQDGNITIANGLVARASDGQESDMFPAYWSPDLRQYINYDGHNGYDFTISYQPVLAAGNGKVAFAGWTDSGYGNMVLIDHQNGYTSLYGHLSKLEVHKGEPVTAGEEIGISGSTGRSSGPHLHFSVFHNCEVTDPYGWTGHGTDPLTTFDGDHAQYLWLPGHDPLVLNPPPHWPAYPTGLKLNASVMDAETSATRTLPAADRLLLLQLPRPTRNNLSTTAVALSRSDALITREAENLVPSLEALKREGLVSGYQILPSAAAVWVRGTASAVQLEALPGVASLTGLRPADLQAAQTGLAHSVLTQVSDEAAPSLWPAGFRSALQTWRPVATAVVGHALVGGAALPGGTVGLTLRRHGRVVATAQAFADAQFGGFATTLHNAAGTPVAVAPGDTLDISSGARSARMHISDLTLKAHVGSIEGKTLPHATVPIAVTSADGLPLWHAVVTAGADGSFSVQVPLPLAAGTEAVVTLGDAAGDQQAASAFVPGIHVDASTGTVHGWTVGNAPQLLVRHAGEKPRELALHLAADGTFQSTFVAGTKLPLLLTLGSRWHHRDVTVAPLRVQAATGARLATVVGPAGQAVTVTLQSIGAKVWATAVHIPRHGAATVRLPRGVAAGDRLSASMPLPRGSSESAEQSLIDLRLYMGTGAVRGTVPPGTDVVVSASGAHGSTLGRSVSGSDAVTGALAGTVVNAAQQAIRLDAVKSIQMSIGGAARTLALPNISLDLKRLSGRFTARLPAGTDATVTLEYPKRHTDFHLHAGTRGTVTATAPAVSTLRKVILNVPVGRGVTLVRVLAIHRASVHRRTASR